MINPYFVRVTPLVAWAIVILCFSLTGMLFLISEPIISSLYTALYDKLPSEGVPIMNMLRMLFYAVTVGFNVLMIIWAFLVTTRRQPVTTPGPVF